MRNFTHCKLTKKGVKMRKSFMIFVLLAVSSSVFAYPYVKCGDGKMWPERIRNTRGVYCASLGPYRQASGGTTCVLNKRVCKRLRP